MNVTDLRSETDAPDLADAEVVVQVPGIWAGDNPPIWRIGVLSRDIANNRLVIELDEEITT